MIPNPEEMDDQRLNEEAAVVVDKIWQIETPRDGGLRAYSVVQTGAWREIKRGDWPPEDLPDYCNDATAASRLLEKTDLFPIIMRPYDHGLRERVYEVSFHLSASDNFGRACHVKLGRALVIALIRATRYLRRLQP